MISIGEGYREHYLLGLLHRHHITAAAHKIRSAALPLPDHRKRSISLLKNQIRSHLLQAAVLSPNVLRQLLQKGVKECFRLLRGQLLGLHLQPKVYLPLSIFCCKDNFPDAIPDISPGNSSIFPQKNFALRAVPGRRPKKCSCQDNPHTQSRLSHIILGLQILRRLSRMKSGEIFFHLGRGKQARKPGTQLFIQMQGHLEKWFQKNRTLLSRILSPGQVQQNQKASRRCQCDQIHIIHLLNANCKSISPLYSLLNFRPQCSSEYIPP